ncbi:MAG: class I SAM-dependent methyltransferase [Planctomycetes bacterium]|nr:class I SAM-dependent methyltransferase [Planctomycetota bacterium]
MSAKKSLDEKDKPIPLVDLTLPPDGDSLPHDVRSFLREADRRIARYCRGRRIGGFMPSDFERVYGVLRTFTAGNVASGNQFCEWGSGFGVVTCLAAMLDFDACGFEIERELVDAAQELAADFDVPVEFICGSFIPSGSEACIDADDAFTWLHTHEGSSVEEFGPADFDVVFAYPWPDEEQLTAALFDCHASAGAVLMTYHGGEDLRLRQKSAK